MSQAGHNPPRGIDYAALQIEANRSIVRSVLSMVEENDCTLPGDHHFFIAFNTRANGVVLSKRLQEQYPREMTVVLQHRFWDLKVFHDRFEVRLTFNNLPERLVVPFASIKVFFDPSVQFSMALEPIEAIVDAGRLADVTVLSTDMRAPAEPVTPDDENLPEPTHFETAEKSAASLSEVEEADDSEANTVVELDAFRKK